MALLIARVRIPLQLQLQLQLQKQQQQIRIQQGEVSKKSTQSDVLKSSGLIITGSISGRVPNVEVFTMSEDSSIIEVPDCSIPPMGNHMLNLVSKSNFG